MNGGDSNLTILRLGMVMCMYLFIFHHAIAHHRFDCFSIGFAQVSKLLDVDYNVTVTAFPMRTGIHIQVCIFTYAQLTLGTLQTSTHLSMLCGKAKYNGDSSQQPNYMILATANPIQYATEQTHSGYTYKHRNGFLSSISVITRAPCMAHLPLAFPQTVELTQSTTSLLIRPHSWLYHAIPSGNSFPFSPLNSSFTSSVQVGEMVWGILYYMKCM